jgi:uroporphyrinogen decarboxylase
MENSRESLKISGQEDTLNNYRRTMRAIAHKPGAPVARGELVIDRQFATDLVNWYDGDAAADGTGNAGLLLACCRLLKLDLVCIPARETACKGTVLAPRPNDIGKFAAHGLFVFWLLDGAFQSAVTERGMMAVMTDLARSPDEAAREIRQRSRQVTADIARGVAAGAHGILIADDIAYRQGTLMAPEFVERCMLTVWKDQTMTAHDLDVPVFFHSDGNLNAVLPFIVEAGFDGLQCLEPDAGMDIGFIKAQYGKALCLMGNVDPALLHASVAGNTKGMGGLNRAVGEVMAAADSRGGLIFGTCSGLHAGMQPERVHHMYRLAAKLDPAATTHIA